MKKEQSDSRMRIVEMMFIVSGLLVAFNSTDTPLVNIFVIFILVSVLYFITLTFNVSLINFGRWVFGAMSGTLFVILIIAYAEGIAKLDLSHPVFTILAVLIILSFFVSFLEPKQRKWIERKLGGLR